MSIAMGYAPAIPQISFVQGSKSTASKRSNDKPEKGLRLIAGFVQKKCDRLDLGWVCPTCTHQRFRSDPATNRSLLGFLQTDRFQIDERALDRSDRLQFNFAGVGEK